ncbi:DUF6152 family protein [Altererythrobacter sp. Root672]|uniref:DUF6152 family protein n=1 Tax=Altererythrobacter sp. Root672 TaxID=1736584 RepID=UPI0006F5E20B|nr:DUF6152 family protein [Altererythrobacter sp. Root672]KRA83621.1 hypothetical protein ASD76_06205 [Altererythrobacter sp. Root672]
MNKRLSSVLAIAGFAAATAGFSTQSQAHHSFSSEFDRRQPVEVQGTVTSARIVNPHGWLYLDVRNVDGTKTNWGFEFGTPIVLKAKGIKREDVRPGTVVRISGYRSKNTGPFGYAQAVELGDGRTIAVGSAPDAPTAQARR